MQARAQGNQAGYAALVAAAAGVLTWVGKGVPRLYLPLDKVFPRRNISQAIVLPKDPKERQALRLRLPELLTTDFSELSGHVKLLSNGPPVAHPAMFRVVGTDAQQVRKCPGQANELLRANASMRDVNDSWNESVKVLRLNIDQDKARTLDASSQTTAKASRTILSSSKFGHYRESEKLIDTALRQPADGRNAFTNLGNAYLPTSSGCTLPLTQIVKVELT